MSGRRVIVTGSRNLRIPEIGDLLAALDAEHARDPIATIVQGGATGADTTARWWANKRGLQCETYKAAWGQYGLRAGPMRNTMMVADGADLVIAAPGGKGTADCVKKARAAGIAVLDLADKAEAGGEA